MNPEACMETCTCGPTYKKKGKTGEKNTLQENNKANTQNKSTNNKTATDENQWMTESATVCESERG